MIKSPVYTAHASTTGGRTGTSATDDGRLSVTLDTPKEMGGNGGPGTNPEQLFAAGYSACFLGAIKAVARGEKVTIPDDAKIDASVSFGENANQGGKGFNIAVELKVTVPGMDRAQVQDLVEKAHQVCPYSNATRGNIDVALSVG
ncbi:organic hydroperoxide resistance protein [Devosia sp. RR2S18]|jgi:osmotically inducible protein OsmC|uniref:organic hydroperoxide resistance protein n=1 Tax=Devosia rhizosphaerae TaxID=3049774 RepID=UPI0025415F19|nr:organic hydroperoxide resistance protein [Devosia sp. RR2S18]WIJ26324.1 organic hydroperoxide resistance protein [Devosia sp. RR2S18]HEV7291609.1 organic hydroperoxide resistance protein [Devosia sp.]